MAYGAVDRVCDAADAGCGGDVAAGVGAGAGVVNANDDGPKGLLRVNRAVNWATYESVPVAVWPSVYRVSFESERLDRCSHCHDRLCWLCCYLWLS